MKKYLAVVACLAGVASTSFAASKSGPVDISALDLIPVRIGAASPVYPASLAASGAKDDVTLVLVIDKAGKVSAVEDVKAAQPAFAEAARAAVKKWLFQPAYVSGKEISFRLPVTLAFRPNQLRDTEADANAVGGGLSMLDVSEVAYKTWPVYPESLRSKPINGEAIVDVFVDAAGVPSDAVVELANNPAFVDPARDAVLNWTFTPAKRGSNAVAMRTQLRVQFAARDAELDAAGRLMKEQVSYVRSYDAGPSVLKKGPLVYPMDALLAGERGTASLMVTVTPEGDVALSSVDLATNPEFGLAARASVAARKFKPATKAGKPVFGAVSVMVNFAETETDIGYDDVARELIEGLRNKTITFPSPRELDAPLRPTAQVAAVLSTDMIGDQAVLEATIEIIIDRNGACRLPRVVKATTPEYGFAAATALMLWRFDPPRKGGKAVDVRVRVPFKVTSRTEPNADAAPAPTPAGS